MIEVDGLDGLGQQAAALERALGGAETMAGAFNQELARMRESMVFTGREVSTLSNGIGRGLRRAFDGLIFDGMKLSDALESVARTMSDSVYAAAMRPVQNAVGGAIANGMNALLSGVLPFADGGVFSQGRVMPFAKGGVVSSPVRFPMRGATGLMGEAGPEAIMPLARGPDGRLGVQAAGGGRAVNVVMNVSTPDVAGFARSQSQIAAQLNRALARGERNR
ncbi:MAG: phage tail tape measure protein [Paracoccaceae bacterium]|jgi:phage-related minor tail protein